MKKYKFYYRNDPFKEQLGEVKAEFREDAIVKAAQIKDLPVSSFLYLFELEIKHDKKN